MSEDNQKKESFKADETGMLMKSREEAEKALKLYKKNLDRGLMTEAEYEIMKAKLEEYL